MAVKSGHPALPHFHELRAPASWRVIEFVSDLHLAEDTPKSFAAFAHYLQHTDADAVLILGDLFEVWVGDDARQTLGFEARCADVLRQAATVRSLGFMAGNRDFLVGADLLNACGVIDLPDPTVLVTHEQRLLLTHGDALCLADTDYQRFRAEVRSTVWRSNFLSRPLTERRAIARQLRDGSEQRKQATDPGDWADVDALAAVTWMQTTDTLTMIHGHTHHPASETLAPGRTRHVLSDWDLDHDPARPRAEVLRWSASGLSRVVPAGIRTV